MKTTIFFKNSEFVIFRKTVLNDAIELILKTAINSKNTFTNAIKKGVIKGKDSYNSCGKKLKKKMK